MKKQTAVKQNEKTNQSTMRNYSLFALLALLCLTFWAYQPSLNGELTNWDDPAYVTNNNLIKDLSFESLKAFFTETVVFNYHPLTMLSLSANYQISGLNPYSYHLVNLLFHLFNTILVFYFISLLTSGKKIVAWIVAALFALHPMHVESVAWISERKDVLYAFFMLASMICFVFYIQQQKRKFYIFAFLLAILALLSKPAAVILPFLLFLLDFWFQRSFSVKTILEKTPFFVLAVIIGVLTVLAQADNALMNVTEYTLWQKTAFASYGFLIYFFKLFWPFNLSAFYPYPISSSSESLSLTYQLAPLFVLLFGVLVAFSYRYTKNILWAILFYFFNIVLVLQFINVGSAIIAERYTYVAYISIFMILALAHHALQDISNQKLGKQLYQFGLVFWGIVVLGCAYLTHERCKVWQNSGTLWQNVVEQFPNSYGAYASRGEYFLEQKKYDKALADFDKALSIRSNLESVLTNRGNIYRQQKKYDKALADYDKAIAIKASEFAHNNRGNAFFSIGKNAEALADYNKAIALAPNYDKGYGNRGAVYFRMGKHDEALADFNKALALNPDYDDAYMNRGVIRSIKGDFANAQTDYTRFLQKNPTHHQSLHWRGIAFLNTEKPQAALQDFDKAIQIFPQQAEYYFNRSKAHKALKQNDKALQDAEQAQKMGYAVDANYFNSLKTK